MFSIDWSELLIVALVAILVISPKDLPRLVRGIFLFMRKVRHMISEAQDAMEKIVDHVHDSDIKKDLEQTYDQIETHKTAIIENESVLAHEKTNDHPAWHQIKARNGNNKKVFKKNDKKAKGDGNKYSKIKRTYGK